VWLILSIQQPSNLSKIYVATHDLLESQNKKYASKHFGQSESATMKNISHHLTAARKYTNRDGVWCIGLDKALILSVR
jgi:hypothetical protein